MKNSTSMIQRKNTKVVNIGGVLIGDTVYDKYKDRECGCHR